MMMSLITGSLLLGVDTARVNTHRAGIDGKQFPLDQIVLENTGSAGGFDYEIQESQDDATGTPFERYISRSHETACLPKLLRSQCADSQLKGIVVFFHGYSSCAIQALAFSDDLTRDCYDVVAPTYPGHGRAPVQCSSEDCDVEWTNGQGWTHSALPTHYSGYKDWADTVLLAIRSEFQDRAESVGKSEDDLEAHVIGLSFGAPMALYATRTNPGFFSRQLLLNPYLALGDEVIDQQAAECEVQAANNEKEEEECEREVVLQWLTPAGITDQDSPLVRLLLGDESNEVVLSLFTTLVKISDTFGNAYRPGGVRDIAGDEAELGMLDSLMESEIQWDGNCPPVMQHRSGGFCMFKKKHYLSTHSFAIHEVVELQSRRAWSSGVPITQITTTARDGRTRNGITYQVARHLANVQDEGKTSMCMHRFRRGTDRSDSGQYWSDENSMPHANLRPDMSWWGSDLKSKIETFITTDVLSVSDSSTWDGSREQCVDLPLERRSYEQNPELAQIVNPHVCPTRSRQLWAGLLIRGLHLVTR